MARPRLREDVNSGLAENSPEGPGRLSPTGSSIVLLERWLAGHEALASTGSGGWRDITTLVNCYQQPDEATIKALVEYRKPGPRCQRGPECRAFQHTW